MAAQLLAAEELLLGARWGLKSPCRPHQLAQGHSARLHSLCPLDRALLPACAALLTSHPVQLPAKRLCLTLTYIFSVQPWEESDLAAACAPLSTLEVAMGCSHMLPQHLIGQPVHAGAPQPSPSPLLGQCHCCLFLWHWGGEGSHLPGIPPLARGLLRVPAALPAPF